ncbi:unnamed protein product [Caretta caretta]
MDLMGVGATKDTAAAEPASPHAGGESHTHRLCCIQFSLGPSIPALTCSTASHLSGLPAEWCPTRLPILPMAKDGPGGQLSCKCAGPLIASYYTGLRLWEMCRT